VGRPSAEPPPSDDEWYAWLAEAHRVLDEWESARHGRMLTLADSTSLAEHVASALKTAFERGRQEHI
jgi:hypothetical protein